MLPLDAISASDIQALVDEQVPETMTVEFKRELSLSNPKHNAEAAKDVSAMANMVGGRIFYGIEEKKLPDGSTVAGKVCPLTDGKLRDQLEHVLLGRIFPRPRFRCRRVVLSENEFVLVVEVYPSYSQDLHMVTGQHESRFYRRNDQCVVPMTEPEIREAYTRIAASHLALDAAVDAAIEAELKIVPHLGESVFVVPLYARDNLVNPRSLGQRFGDDLCANPGRWRVVWTCLERQGNCRWVLS